jgi:VWFA-related protein
MRKVLLPLLVCAVAATAAAQVPEPVNIKVSVNLVEVPVSVVDAAGNPIRGLTAANFHVAEDSAARTVTAFDVVDYGTSGNTEAPKLRPPAASARRNFLLLFDLSYGNPKSFSRAQKAARDFVANAVAANDLVGVATIDAERGMRLLSAFTTDRSLTEAAVANPSELVSHDPLQIAGRYAFQPVANGAPRVGADPELIAGHMKLYLDTTHENEQFERRRVELQLGWLGQLAMMMRRVPGRKQVVLLSEGFSAQSVQGRDVRDSAESATEMEQVTRGATFRIDNDVRLGSTAALTALADMTKTFREADVVLHAIDLQGVRLENDVATGARLNSNDGLGILTRATGGTLFERSNDLSSNFGRLLHEQEVVYILGFQTANDTPGRFHPLTVRVTGIPSGAKVYSRSGYYEAGLETPQERALTNAEVILNDLPQEGLRVAAHASALPVENGAARVPVTLEIRGEDILQDVLDATAGLEVFVYAFGEDGNVRDSIYNGITLDLAKIGRQLQSTGVRFSATLALPPGKYAIRSLVRVAKTGRRGFVRTDVTVGDATTTAASAPSEEPGWLLVRGTMH